jgi:hypothetical protein
VTHCRNRGTRGAPPRRAQQQQAQAALSAAHHAVCRL